jgi:anti-anti-sigma factor
MLTAPALFEREWEGETVILTPQADLSELDYRRLQAQAKDLLSLVDGAPARNVVLDFGRTDYFGSTALGLLLVLLKNVRKRGGKMLLCNVSGRERELLRLTMLNRLWRIYPSREEALAVLDE